MTNKERYEMLCKWVEDLNHKAFLKKADARFGGLYAIATKNPDGGIKIWSQFMTLKELEKCLVMFFDNDFIKIKEV